MADVVDKATRSRMMAGIKGKNTKPELSLRRCLHAAGLRYRLHSRELPGAPDLVLPKFGCAVFVHGCFWHWHECRHSKVPATRPEFWIEKLKKNRERDRRTVSLLTSSGWRCAIVWECAIRRDGSGERVSSVARSLEKWIRHGKSQLIEFHEKGGHATSSFTLT